MKILVLGHSDSDGSRLANPSDGWPWLLQRMLKDAAGIECEVAHRLLYAGPTAGDFVEKQVQSHRPDIVVLATTTHGVVVRLVSNRVRERWGERAARLVHRAEISAAERWARSRRPTAAAIMALRRTARRLLGTGPTMSSDALVASYEDCMMRLARVENLPVIIGGGIGYIGEIRALNPGIDALQADFQRRFRTLAEAHRFDWLSHEEVLGGPGTKDQYYFPDGIHTDERSHRLFAEALLPLVLARS